MSELKPCPFCGYDDLDVHVGVHNGALRESVTITCNECLGSIYGSTEEWAIKRWNTRAEQTCTESRSDTRTVYVIEVCDELTGEYCIEPVCYRNREDAVRRCESQNYTDEDGVRNWAILRALEVVGE